MEEGFISTKETQDGTQEDYDTLAKKNPKPGYVIKVATILSIEPGDTPGIVIDCDSVNNVQGVGFTVDKDGNITIQLDETVTVVGKNKKEKKKRTLDEEWRERVETGVQLHAICPKCGGSSISTCPCAKKRFLIGRQKAPKIHNKISF